MRGLAADLLLRSALPLAALLAIWGGALYGPWFVALTFFAAFHGMRYAEQRFGHALPLPPERLGRRTRLLAHPEDVHVVLFMLLYWAGLASAFYVCHSLAIRDSWSFGTRVTMGLTSGLWLGWVGGVNTGINYHSHAHRGVFKLRWLNRWVGRLWTIPGGIPAFFWSYKHLAVHHRYLHEPGDWVQPKRLPGGRYESLYRYALLYWPWRWARHFYADFSRAPRRLRRRACLEFGFFLALWCIPFWIDLSFGLTVWLFHQWVGNAAVMGSGMYAQHAGCTNDQRFSHSNTFVCAFFNKLMFNAGFHIEHTTYPAVHWSELPSLHARMRAELLAHGAHILPYGIFRGAGLLSSITNADAAYADFQCTSTKAFDVSEP